MTNRRFLLILAAVLALGLFVFAFVAAPKSCEWGLAAYFWSGVVVEVLLVASPLVLRRADPLLSRFRAALLLGLLGVVVWMAGLFAADMQIICRLF